MKLLLSLKIFAMNDTTITDQSFQDEVLKYNGLVMVDFYAPWCGPCKMMGPSIEKLAKEYEGKVKIVKFNVDEGEQISNQYGIQSIPTLIFFKEGEMIDRMEGFQSEENLREKLNNLTL